jgi:predicted RNA-binding protein YlxR (DUF448 family)
MRMCVGCRNRKKKSELLRFTRRSDGNFAPAGKKDVEGRGFYLCPDWTCLRKAQKRNRAGQFTGIRLQFSSSDETGFGGSRTVQEEREWQKSKSST